MTPPIVNVILVLLLEECGDFVAAVTSRLFSERGSSDS